MIRAAMPLGFAALLGESPAFMGLRNDLQQVVRRYAGARRVPPVLLLGESGTGKTLIARVLHHEGPRSGRPFVDVACPAIPETLMESQMFGFERGAFTDARESKAGLFAAADRGTIFLDEIGLLPDNLQVKLLKVVEDQQLRPLGATVSTPLDVWVIAATSADLEAAVRKRRFRKDLYYRLAVVTVHMPPLRERGEDVVILAQHMLARACADYALAPKTLTSEALDRLRAHRWPGNIRELANVIERVALRADGALVTPAVLGLPDPPSGRAMEVSTVTSAPTMSERDRLVLALTTTNGNISQAAAMLGLTRNAFRYRLRKTGLAPARGEIAAVPVVSVPADEAHPVAVLTHWERRRVAFLRVALIPPGDDGEPKPSLLLDEVRQKALVFGGTFDGISPAGVTVVFGLDAVEDAAARAAHAAMAIRKLGARTREVDPVTPVMKLALHATPALLRKVDDRVQVDGDARPKIWGILERLLERAAAGDIVVSEPATVGLGPSFHLLAAGPGNDGAHLLLDGERPATPRTMRSVFLGRRDEMAMLQGRLERALTGRGQVVAVDGEPGIGKSRVLFEFHRVLEPAGVGYLAARSVSYGRDVPLLPVVELVHRACGVDEDDKPDVILTKVHSTVTALGMPVDDTAPFLLRLMGLREGTDRITHLSPQSLRQRSLEMFRELVLASSRVRPLVIAMEDLHWIDRASEGYVAALVDVLIDAPILLVTACRTGYVPPWRDRSYFTELRLQPLARGDARRVLDDTLERDPSAAPATDATAEAILDRADGNPFFIEELARAVGSAPAAEVVPESIEAVLLARIDRLTDEAKAVLQAASVLGRDIPLPVLEAVIPQIPAWREHLRELQGLEYVHELSHRAHEQYRFKHALTQEVAYSSLLPAQRHTLHAGIVAAVEEQYADRLEDQTERLAHHAVRGRLWGKAVGYLRQAGLRAVRRAANHEATACFEQALAALGQLPDGAAAMAIDLRLDLYRALLPLGQYRRCEDYLAEAARLATTHGERRRLGHVLGGLCLMRRAAGALEDAIAAGRQALAIATEVGDVELAVSTNLWLGTAHYTRAEFREAIACFRASFSPPTADRPWADVRSAGGARSWLAWALESLGEFGEALTQGHHALELAEAHDDRLMQASARCLLANVYLGLGDSARAVIFLEPALKLCTSNGHRDFLGPVQMRLGFAYALGGLFAEGIRLGEEGVVSCRAIGAITGLPTRLAGLAQSYLLAGLPTEAEKTARDGVALARELYQPAGEAWGLHVLGLIGAATNEPTIAEAHFARSRDLALALEMRPLVAHNHLGLARVYRTTDRRAQAEDDLATAVRMYDEMGMARWLERARTT